MVHISFQKIRVLILLLGRHFGTRSCLLPLLTQKNRGSLVVLLPYFVEDAENILNLLNKSNIPVQNIIVKAHPATPAEKFKSILHPNAKVAGEDVYELFKTAKIVIGAASGNAG